MILHYIIKKIISDYGKIVISDLRLYNILSDLNGFKYEPESIRFILKQVLLLRGKEILNSQDLSLPVHATINQYTQFITDNCGFVENQVRYVVESIAFGIGWLKNLSECTSHPKNFEQKLEITALLYNLMGLNITQIQGSKSLNQQMSDLYYQNYHWGEDKKVFDSFKNPVEENWKDYFIKLQDSNYINNLSWKDKTGIGIICGFNDIRVIDIDGISCFNNCEYDFWIDPRKQPNNQFDAFVEYCLTLLNLPKDYKWVVRTGSGHGIHIIIKCEDINDTDLEVVGFYSNIQKDDKRPVSSLVANCIGNDVDFDRLELYWKGHITAYPSRGNEYKDYDAWQPFEPNLKKYDFINTHDTVPLEEPSYVSVNDIDNLLLNLCGKVTSEWHEYDETKKKFSEFYHITKLKNACDSGGNIKHFKDSFSWLEKCSSSEGINSLGVYYALKKQYETASEYFKLSKSEFAHYNLAILILFGYINGTKNEVLEHYNLCKNSCHIHQYDIDDIKKYLDNF